MSTSREKPKRAPVQGWPAGIPWELHLEAYAAYCKRWGPQPALIDLEGRNCRGGFGTDELDEFVPGWRDRASEITALRAEVERLRETKDGAYLERNRCVALIARMALAMGLRAGLARTAIEGWSEDWHGCVYIDLPTGQCSWHFHDSQAHLFDGLPTYAGKWDGHTTPEKYGRVDAALR